MAFASVCCSSIHSMGTACWRSHGWSSTAGWPCLKAYTAEGNLASLAESCMSPCIGYGLCIYTTASPEFIYCSQLLYWKVMTTCLKTPYIGCYCFFAMWLHCRLTMLNAKGPYISYLISIQVNTILHAFSLTRDFWVFVYIAMKIKRCRMPTLHDKHSMKKLQFARIIPPTLDLLHVYFLNFNQVG